MGIRAEWAIYTNVMHGKPELRWQNAYDPDRSAIEYERLSYDMFVAAKLVLPKHVVHNHAIRALQRIRVLKKSPQNGSSAKKRKQ